ncbi:MAG: hypothetical protein K1X79_03135 [Oligoflexia bacterium]|nr:hypothetical protein [Oligoflexia bacterium]
MWQKKLLPLLGWLGAVLIGQASSYADFSIVGAVNNRIGNAIAAGNILGGSEGQFIYGEPFALSGNKGRATVRTFDSISGTSSLLFTISGNVNADRLGMSVAISRVGSIVPRVAAGAINDITKLGYVKVYSANGTAVGTISGGATTFFADSLAIAHDLNSDGVDDLVVGSSVDPSGGNFAGKVTVYSGASPFPVLFSFTGSAGDRLGVSVATGDVNQDGTDDIIAGALGEQIFGAVHVFSGADGSSILSVSGSSVAANSFFGRSVSFGGDVNGDNTPDILVGSSGSFNEPAGSQLGAVHVLDRYGNLVLNVSGENSAFGFGSVVSGPADFDGDGISDFAVSSPTYTDGSSSTLAGGLLQSGRVQLYRGPAGALFRTFLNSYTATSSLMGTGLAATVDLNADGVTDVLMGSPYFTNPPGSPSSAYHGRVDFAASTPPTPTPSVTPSATPNATQTPNLTAVPTASPTAAVTSVASPTATPPLASTAEPEPTQPVDVAEDIFAIRESVSLSKKLRLTIRVQVLDALGAAIDVSARDCAVELNTKRRGGDSRERSLGKFPFLSGSMLTIGGHKIPLLNLSGKRAFARRRILAGPFVEIVACLRCDNGAIELSDQRSLRQPVISGVTYLASFDAWSKKVRRLLTAR